jgi:GAF domain-containing protein
MREMKGQNPELESIGKFAASISGELDPPSIFRKALLTLNQVLGYERAFLYLIREDRLILEGQAGYEKIPSKLPLSGGVAASVVITGKPVFLKGGGITPPSTSLPQGEPLSSPHPN